jgi:hypothetical protein
MSARHVTPDELTALADARNLPYGDPWDRTGDYYSRQGEPITMRQWVAAFEYDRSLRFVAQTTVRGVRVSTIWLGLDHSYGRGPILIFETMLFAKEARGRTRKQCRWLRERDQDGYRWTTEVQALAGHDQHVAEVRARLRTPAERRAERRRLAKLLRRQRRGQTGIRGTRAAYAIYDEAQSW